MDLIPLCGLQHPLPASFISGSGIRPVNYIAQDFLLARTSREDLIVVHLGILTVLAVNMH
jgi:hypothetical protein